MRALLAGLEALQSLALAKLGASFPLVGEMLATVGGVFAGVGIVLALVGQALPLVGQLVPTAFVLLSRAQLALVDLGLKEARFRLGFTVLEREPFARTDVRLVPGFALFGLDEPRPTAFQDGTGTFVRSGVAMQLGPVRVTARNPERDCAFVGLSCPVVPSGGIEVATRRCPHGSSIAAASPACSRRAGEESTRILAERLLRG